MKEESEFGGQVSGGLVYLVMNFIRKQFKGDQISNENILSEWQYKSPYYSADYVVLFYPFLALLQSIVSGAEFETFTLNS